MQALTPRAASSVLREGRPSQAADSCVCNVATLRVRALCRLAGIAWGPASVACRVSGELLSRRSTLVYTSRTVDALEHCWLRVVAVKPKGCAPMVKRVYTPCEWACTWNFEGLRPHPSPGVPRGPPGPAHDSPAGECCRLRA